MRCRRRAGWPSDCPSVRPPCYGSFRPAEVEKGKYLQQISYVTRLQVTKLISVFDRQKAEEEEEEEEDGE